MRSIELYCSQASSSTCDNRNGDADGQVILDPSQAPSGPVRFQGGQLLTRFTLTTQTDTVNHLTLTSEMETAPRGPAPAAVYKQSP